MSEAASNGKAVIVVDMQKDNVGRFCQEIIPNLQLLIKTARENGALVVFACDSRYPDDFIFKGGHPISAIRGTEGVRVIEDLAPQQGDIIVEKRMLSGFFGSDLEFTLRQKGIDTVIVTGVATWACVLKTAFDAAELGYRVMVPADCCSSPRLADHEAALGVFKALRVYAPSVKEAIEVLSGP